MTDASSCNVRRLLIVSGNINIADIDALVKRMSITDLIVTDRDIQNHYPMNPTVVHCDELLPCTAAEAALFEKQRGLTRDIVARGRGRLDGRHRNIPIADACRMILSSSLFHVMRRLAVLEEILTGTAWDRVFVLNGGMSYYMDEALSVLADTGLCAGNAAGWLADEPPDGLPEPLPAPLLASELGRDLHCPGIDRRDRAKMKAHAKCVLGHLDSRLTASDADRVQLARRIEDEDIKAPVLMIFAEHPEYSRTAELIGVELATHRAVIALTEGDVAPVRLLASYTPNPIVFASAVGNHLDEAACREIRATVRQCLKRFEKTGGRYLDPTFPETLKHRAVISQYVDLSFWIYLVDHVIKLEKLYRIIETAKPASLVLINSQFKNGALAAAIGKALGIPTIDPQESLYSANDRGALVTARYATAMDVYQRQAMARVSGKPETDFRITGTMPRIEEDRRLGPRVFPEAVRRRLGVAPERPLAVFALQPFGARYLGKLLRTVVRVMDRFPDAHLILKTHPSHEARVNHLIQGILGELPSNVSVLSDIDMISLIVASETVIAAFSTVTLETAFFDKPGIVFNLLAEPHPLPYVEQGIALGASSEEELAEVLRQVFEKGPKVAELARTRAAYFRTRPFERDGLATKRVAAFIEWVSQGGKGDADIPLPSASPPPAVIADRTPASVEGDLLSQKVQLDPDDIDPRLLLIPHLLAEGRDSEAIDALTRSLRLSERLYLERRTDVAAAVAKGGFRSGLEHFDRYGRHEGADWPKAALFRHVLRAVIDHGVEGWPTAVLSDLLMIADWFVDWKAVLESLRSSDAPASRQPEGMARLLGIVRSPRTALLLFARLWRSADYFEGLAEALALAGEAAETGDAAKVVRIMEVVIRRSAFDAQAVGEIPVAPIAESLEWDIRLWSLIRAAMELHPDAVGPRLYAAGRLSALGRVHDAAHLLEDAFQLSERLYLVWRPDVARACHFGHVPSGLDHFLQYGRDEGWSWPYASAFRHVGGRLLAESRNGEWPAFASHRLRQLEALCENAP